MDLGLTDTQRVAIRRAAKNGDYHLFLGAGASRDSRGPSGDTLPGSAELIDMLATDFRVPAEEDDQLWRVYQRAIEPPHSAALVYAWFRKKFWGVTPPYWMSYFARSPWSVVWTLNVDDTFEAAYREITTESTRKMVTVSWDTDYRQGRELNIVHLHGVVDRDEPRPLVFSLSEYAESAGAQSAWRLNFRDMYGVSPFVILGARLRDEPDIEAVVSQRLPTHAAPSFYVSSHISGATERDMRRWNLTPVRATAEDFALEWAELTGLELDHNPSEDVEIGLRLGRQLIELRTNVSSSPVKGHDFLGGDEPRWSDILSGLSVDLEWIQKARKECAKIGVGVPASSALVYVGRRLTGRSTGLLMLARELRARSWRTYLYAGEGRPDTEAILKFASDGRPIAILFDGIAEIADDAETLVREARAAALQLALIAVDDVDRSAGIIGRIRPNLLANRQITTINSKLSRSDAAHLVDGLHRVGRLGFLEAEKEDRRRLAHFVGHEIFDSMAQLENAPGFGRRVGELVDRVRSQARLRLVLIAAFASRTGQRLLAIDAARMVGMESDLLMRAILSESELSTLLSTDGLAVKTRHRWMALDAVIAKLGTEASLGFIGEALRRVHPRLSRASQIERNSTALLVGALMSQKNLATVFPIVALDPWYEGLLDVFGSWSGRYWEQRAIVARRQAESDPRQLSKAESFALRACDLVSDPYSYTTLGTVLLAKAAYLPQVDTAKYYTRGVEAFGRANALDLSNVVTWLAYLRYSLPVLRLATRKQIVIQADDTRGVTSQSLSDQVANDWLGVYNQLAAIATSTEETASALRSLKQSFDSMISG